MDVYQFKFLVKIRRGYFRELTLILNIKQVVVTLKKLFLSRLNGLLIKL